jgi:hypothetical protein
VICPPEFMSYRLEHLGSSFKFLTEELPQTFENVELATLFSMLLYKMRLLFALPPTKIWFEF